MTYHHQFMPPQYISVAPPDRRRLPAMCTDSVQYYQLKHTAEQEILSELVYKLTICLSP